MPAGSHAAPRGKDSLSRVNKTLSTARSSFRSQVHLGVLIAWVGLLLFGTVVIWTASLSIADASFAPPARHRHRRRSRVSHLAFRRLLQPSKPLDRAFGHRYRLGVPAQRTGPSVQRHGHDGLDTHPVNQPHLSARRARESRDEFFMSALGAQYHGKIDTLRDYVKLCGMLAIPFACVIIQGDLGSGLVVFVSGAIVIMMSGARKEWVLMTLALIIGLVSLMLATDSIIDGVLGDSRSFIKNYQMNRLLVFLDPEADTSGAGYNLQQSLIAVGSGGFFGKGIGNATTIHLGLPARGTYRLRVRPALRDVRVFPVPSCSLLSSPYSCSQRFASPSNANRSSIASCALGSLVCGCSRFLRTSACASGLCPSRVSRCHSSASDLRL